MRVIRNSQFPTGVEPRVAEGLPVAPMEWSVSAAVVGALGSHDYEGCFFADAERERFFVDLFQAQLLLGPAQVARQLVGIEPVGADDDLHHDLSFLTHRNGS